MIEKTCVICGKPFMTYNKNQRACSTSCGRKLSWEKRNHAETIEYTCEVCGKKFSVPKSDHRTGTGTIRYCSKKCDGIGKRTGKTIPCPICGKPFYTTRAKTCSRECGWKHASMHKVKRIYDENGYDVMHINGYNKKGNAKIHRLVMEQQLGRRLTDDEVVHHINGNKKDNRPENLQVMTKSEHSRMHRMKEVAEGRKLFGRD